MLARLRRALARNPVAALLGPRQCGKSTLARELVRTDTANYFDLEDPAGLARLAEPMTALAGLRGTIVIDEVQRRPDLFPVLRVLADRRPRRARFLVLGSASPELLRQTSESLAGRVELIELSGFGLQELGERALERHWLRGGFPRSYLAKTPTDSFEWRAQFIRSLIERDLPQLGIANPAQALQRFWTMLAHYHGQVWNAAEPARSLGASEPSMRRYLDLLTGLFMVRQLKPWHENLAKRQVKAPKIYVRDSGLLHQLLGIRSERDLLAHPKCGASWEGYALEQALDAAPTDQAYYWATYQGADLDLLLMRRGRRYGIEAKRADAPRLTASMRVALHDLQLSHVAVLYPGNRRYRIADRVTAVPLAELATDGAETLF